jgi:hypothetical protein
MNRSPAFLFRLLAGTLTTVAFLSTAVFSFADIYTDLPSQLVGYDSNSEIHIHSASDANVVRQNVVSYLWGGSGLPTELPTSTPVYSGGGTLPADLVGLNVSNIASAEKWQANMDFGYGTSMYLLRPANTSNAQRLAIVHHGHVGYAGRFSIGIGAVTDNLLKNGFTVLEMQMPLMGWNTQTRFDLPSGTVSLGSHDAMVGTLESQPGGSSLRFFLEPVIQGINKFIQTTPNFTDISMMGLSGGGWTTTLAAAIDPRIKLSVPVAGSEPLYARPYYPGSVGDAEQYLSTMYNSTAGKASYLDLYALGSTGDGRRQIQLLNQYDNCCFYGVAYQTWVDNVKTAVASTGAGTYDFYLDTTAHSHQISTNAINNVIDPALGIIPVLPQPPAINEQFSAPGTPPPGWSYDPRNGGVPTISSSGGVVAFSGGSGVVSIVNNTTFNPQALPISASMKINSLGAGGYLGFFITNDPSTRAHIIGLQVSSSGTLLLGIDHGGAYQNHTLTTLSGYDGGSIMLTLTFDANGFTAATDVGNFSTTQTYASLGSGFNISNLGGEASLFIQNFNTPANGTVDWISVVPEPCSLALLGMGVYGAALWGWRWRKHKER